MFCNEVNYSGAKLCVGFSLLPTAAFQPPCRLFDLQSRQWRQLPVRGMSPLPRFLFGYTQFSPAGGGADRFVLFGGQTGALLGGRAAGSWLSLGRDERDVCGW